MSWSESENFGLYKWSSGNRQLPWCRMKKGLSTLPHGMCTFTSLQARHLPSATNCLFSINYKTNKVSSNRQGSLVGMLGGIAIVLTISAGSIIDSDSIPNQKLPLSTSGCSYWYNETTIVDPSFRANTDWRDAEYTSWEKIISLAPTWYPGLGNLSTIALGLIFSFALKKFQKVPPVKREHLSEPILNLWERTLPTSWIQGWVEPPPSSTSESKEQKLV